eukprot:394254-Prymnesium_polylepis.2
MAGCVPIRVQRITAVSACLTVCPNVHVDTPQRSSTPFEQTLAAPLSNKPSQHPFRTNPRSSTPFGQSQQHPVRTNPPHTPLEPRAPHARAPPMSGARQRSHT